MLGSVGDAGGAAARAGPELVEVLRRHSDPRYFNTACKLTGLALLSYRDTQDPTLAKRLGGLGLAIRSATRQLSTRLQQHLIVSNDNRPDMQDQKHTSDEQQRTPHTGRMNARIAVLTPPGGRLGRSLVASMAEQKIAPAAVCWYAPDGETESLASNYSTAWYPAAQAQPPNAVSVPAEIAAGQARSWRHVVDVLRMMDIDLLILSGMPVVPTQVLATARLGAINAHNGALPAVRGMDAVGWAVITNQPIVCTAHMARARADTGEIIATTTIEPTPTATLAARVRSAQIRLLETAAGQVAATGILPDLTAQQGTPCRYYRLHPHLKRILDASPYNNHDEEGELV